MTTWSSATPAGEPLWGRHLTTLQLKGLLRRAGLPAIRFHDLRHTFATLQLAAGTNPKIVSEVLGHKEVAITLGSNSHALPTMHTKAMARLDTILGRRANPRTVPTVIRAPIRAPQPPRRQSKGPDPSVDRAEKGEIGTAYRIRGRVRRSPTEHDSSGGIQRIPTDSGRPRGTNDGT